MEKRKTIGLVINCLEGNYLTYFWLMLKKAAEKFGCNLIVYEGRVLNYYSDYTRKQTIVYGFIDKKRVDGLIITSAVTDHVSDENINKFLRRFKDIPLVSIGRIIPKTTSVLVDNKTGMKSLIKHLVKDHEYRKIIFVTGPKNNCEAVERYEAYLEVLEENNIDVDEDIVFEGDFNSHTGYEIMKKVILKGIEYDAAVFSNDDMALGAIKAIEDLSKEYNIDVSKKNTICGFDNTTKAKLTTPSLTTVSQPFEDICQGAVKALLEKIDGKKTEDIIKYPAVLVKRQSCGCKKQSLLDEISNKSLRLIPQSIFNIGVQTYNLNDICKKITKEFKRIGLKNCFISTYYEGTIMYNDTLLLKESFEVPKKSVLLYAYCNGERVNVEEEKLFDTKNLIPESFIPKDRRFNYLIKPLYFGEDNFGFMCIELVSDDVLHFELLRIQISNVLNGALLLMEKDRIKRVLVESERLASLGHLVGGISHNLMSPIMSISGVSSAMESLADEYENSLEDSEVTKEDYIEILDEMKTWNSRLKEYKNYMEKVILSINAQAEELNSNTKNEFTVDELMKKIKFNLNNNIKLSKCKLNVKTEVTDKIKISGDITSLVKIINNILVNGVESYSKEDEKAYIIDFYVCYKEEFITIKIRNYGDKILSSVKDKIFKHMVTSKGKNGTGLSLLLSHSTIKARFGGEIWFEEPEGKGVTFYISIPVKRQRENNGE
ncbi:substrate-binding domain-containing protein [Herbivorax sp. ANBcel31]|uniref:substrate-binding domain-containing protein n=1 Tax=Herbivorax sp. ANBcel31 TaxID=3069754 RepID=UPI0027B1E2CD|nr:substrate-binding domain-containing protein [Herbivorax sp. ANBcel31]MDQ2087069.1 substrate-binding domain-containing protein [Herbivorax sp. ANBcel31]